ncbi:MAG: thymidine kinase, partial [Planctomycetia bacterium]
MAKLYFRYGTVGSAKTLNLLAVAHNYERQGRKVLVAKPVVDTRDGVRTIASRAGLHREADLLLGPEDRLEVRRLRHLDALLVDEAQFLSEANVEGLRRLTVEAKVPVLCYGLRADFRGRLFEGSKRLFELADTIEEVKTICADCTRKAIMNMRLVDGQPTLEGPSVQLGGDESYKPQCYAHWLAATAARRPVRARRAGKRTPPSPSRTARTA